MPYVSNGSGTSTVIHTMQHQNPVAADERFVSDRACSVSKSVSAMVGGSTLTLFFPCYCNLIVHIRL